MKSNIFPSIMAVAMYALMIPTAISQDPARELQGELSGQEGPLAENNVGIGVTNPVQKLQVNGNVAAQFGTATSPSYIFGTGTEATGVSSPAPYVISVINNGLEAARFTPTQQLGIGTNSLNSSALVEMYSTTRGLLVPRMTETQRNAISSPAEGLLIYNTSLDKFDYYTGGEWKTVLSTTSSSGGSAEGSGYCSEGVTDYDGHHYRTVKVGDQCWMAENLRSTHYASGAGITGVYNYGDQEHNSLAFGKLYTWAAVMNSASSSDANPSGVQGACPNGWHVPSDSEWKQLEKTLGMSQTDADVEGYRGTHNEGLKMKATDDHGFWQAGSNPGNDATGLSAFPGGHYYDITSGYADIYVAGYFFTCTQYTSNTAFAMFRKLNYNEDQVYRQHMPKTSRLSVRCLRN